jgi:hypothetical protein
VTSCTVPSRTIQHHTTPYQALPSHIMPYYTMVHHTISHYTTPHYAMLLMSCHAMTHSRALMHSASNQIKPYFNVSYLTSTPHTIFHHTTHDAYVASQHTTHNNKIIFHPTPQHITQHHSTHTYMYSRCNRIVTSIKSIRMYHEHKTIMSKDVRT